MSRQVYLCLRSANEACTRGQINALRQHTIQILRAPHRRGDRYGHDAVGDAIDKGIYRSLPLPPTEISPGVSSYIQAEGTFVVQLRVAIAKIITFGECRRPKRRLYHCAPPHFGSPSLQKSGLRPSLQREATRVGRRARVGRVVLSCRIEQIVA